MKSEHAGILYPADATELYEAVTSTGVQNDIPELQLLQSLPAAIVTPHGSYANILPFLHQAYATTTELHPKLIVLLAPLHRPVLLEDSSFTLFLAEADSWETPLGKLSIAKALASLLNHEFPTEMGKRNAYFQEESAIELQLPFCLHHFPQVPILPIVGTWEQEASHSSALALVKAILTYEKRTLFIITSNTVTTQETTIDGKKSKPCAEHWIHVIDEIAKTSDWTGSKAVTPSDNFEQNTIHYFSTTKEWT